MHVTVCECTVASLVPEYRDIFSKLMRKLKLLQSVCAWVFQNLLSIAICELHIHGQSEKFTVCITLGAASETGEMLNMYMISVQVMVLNCK